MTAQKIWELWLAEPCGHSTAKIAEILNLHESDVDRVVSACLSAIYYGRAMTWEKGAA